MNMTAEGFQTRSWPNLRQWATARNAILLSLVAILALQSIATLTLHNTAFQDEALYIYSGRAYFTQLLGGPIVQEPYARYLSGLPYFYPIIAGALDLLGGLQVVRFFSLLCMLFTTVMVYLAAQHMFRQDVGVLAAGLFAVQGAVIFLGGLATYDALCLALLSAAVVLAVRLDTRKHLLYAVAIGGLLFAATAAKYAALLFVPGVLAIMGWQLFRNFGFWRAVIRLVIATGVFALATAVVMLASADVREGIAFTTTARVSLSPTPALILIENIFLWLGPLILLGLVGLLLNARNKPVLALIFFGMILLAPTYHIYKTEITSMHKHMAFSAMFAAPLAAYAVAQLAGYMRREYVRGQWIVAVAILLMFWNSGLGLAQGFYAQWTDSTTMVNVLRTQVRPNGRVLAEESEVPRYYLQDIAAFWQWNNLYFFAYTDKAGHQLTGVDAYKAAINEGYWDLIVFRYGPSEAVARAIDGTITSSTKYELITKVPTGTATSNANYWIWRKVTS